MRQKPGYSLTKKVSEQQDDKPEAVFPKLQSQLYALEYQLKTVNSSSTKSQVTRVVRLYFRGSADNSRLGQESCRDAHHGAVQAP